jgi:glutaminyl-tRNA synthetase
LFCVEDPSQEEGDFKDFINSYSLSIIENAYIEPELANAKVGDYFQFLRKGYFVLDKNSSTDKPVFNLTVGLKDNWK